MRVLSIVWGVCLVLGSAGPLAAQSYEFATFTWDQRDTPDRTTLLAPGAYGDVSMTLAPTSATGSPAFPVAPDLVFIDTLSPGAAVEPPLDDPYGPRALNLPSGNNGTTQRSGFEMSWSNSRVLTNDTGDDLVIYESGSPGAPEGFIVRVHVSGGSWTNWWYESDDGFEQYPPAGPDGAFATAIDLTDLGVAGGASIDMVQIANLRDTDRLATGSDAQGGFIDPAGTVVPQNSSAATYAGGSLDPDIMYVASLHDVAGTAASDYSFATFTWDQNDSPDTGSILAPGAYGDATITNQPTGTTDQVDFPDLLAGYDSNRSPGQFLGLDTDGTVGINMPLGNDGTTNRSGIQVGWSGGLGIRNLSGDDLIVFESGSPEVPEGFMIRVYDFDAGTWTRWYHEPYDEFGAYSNGLAQDGAFATAFDFTSLGVPASNRVTAVQIANLRSTDLIDSGTTTGFVFPEGTGADGGDTAQPYDMTELDPDILYVASLQAAVGPNTAPLVDVGVTPATTPEGSEVTLNGAVSDAEGGDLEVTVDWGDGSAPETFTVPDGTSNFSRPHTYLDDNPSGTASDLYTVSVTVEDDNGETTPDSTDVTVQNVAPVFSNLALSETMMWQPTTLSGNITDPGTLDTFTLQVDWGDGQSDTYNYPAGTTAFSETHTYAATGSYVVSLSLADDDLGTATAVLTAIVSPVQSVPTASPLALALLALALAAAGLWFHRS
jgi:hypothetical protein